jgi:hypothetical protein
VQKFAKITDFFKKNAIIFNLEVKQARNYPQKLRLGVEKIRQISANLAKKCRCVFTKKSQYRSEKKKYENMPIFAKMPKNRGFYVK